MGIYEKNGTEAWFKLQGVKKTEKIFRVSEADKEIKVQYSACQQQ